MVISYGNNNYVTKILLKDILISKKENNPKFEFKTISFNSHIHTTEDLILKRLCRELGIDTEKAGFDGARSAIEEFYKNLENKRKNSSKKSSIDNEPLIVIFFENIEYLFLKKKQVLFYTILEIVNISSNMLFCGMTSNFNLTDMMEKRIRSRFSQKTIFIRIPDGNSIIGILEDIFYNTSKSIDIESKSSLQIFYKILLTTNKLEEEEKNSKDKLNFNLILLIQKYVNLGISIKEIITKLKYILTMILMNIKKIQDKDVFNFSTKIKEIVDVVITEYVTEENNGSYFNLLKSECIICKVKINYIIFFYLDFPKLHIILLICLWRCVGKYKDKITIGMIYAEYSLFCQPKYNANSGLSKTKLDLIVVKKALEELLNSNLISVKNDEKYLQVYELKLPYELTQNTISKLDDYNNFNFDSEMKQFLNISFS